MQRIALLTLALMLSGCGYKTWWNPPFTGGSDPNLPRTDSENMRRVQGEEPAVPTLTTEPGDIWPGPLAPPPTLKDLETAGGVTPQPEAPVPGSPLSRGIPAPYPSPSPSPRRVLLHPKITSLVSRHPNRLHLCRVTQHPLPHRSVVDQPVRSFKRREGQA